MTNYELAADLAGISGRIRSLIDYVRSNQNGEITSNYLREASDQLLELAKKIVGVKGDSSERNKTCTDR